MSAPVLCCDAAHQQMGNPQPAVAWAGVPQAAMPGGHFVVLRDINCAPSVRAGTRPLCLDCCHHLVDGMVMASRPRPTPDDIPAAERMEPPA